MSPKLATAATVAGVTVVGAYSIHAYLNRTAFAETDEPPMVFNGRIGFTSLSLHSVKAVSHDTKRLVFELPDRNARSGLTLTSSLLTISRPQGSWLPVARPYTPINNFNKPGFIELLVKKYPNGKASTHLHSLEPGQSLWFAGPLKGYAWSPNKHSHIYMLAGGAGITPIYQLIQGALGDPDDRTEMTLVFGANSEENLVLRDELEGFKSRFPGRFDVVYTVNNQAKNAVGSTLQQGRITESLLRQVMKGPEEKNVQVLVCGPPAMESALMGSNGREKGILGQLGYTKDQIYRF